MGAKRCLLCLLIVWVGQFLGYARAADHIVTGEAVTTQIGAGPVHVVMRPGAKTMVLFTTPCMLLNHLDGGVGPFAALREQMARRLIESNRFLLVEFQPVCM